MQEINIKSNFSIDASNYRLYSAAQIIVATILCSIISGRLLLPLDYSKLGDEKNARRVVYLSIAAFILQLTINVIVIILFDLRSITLLSRLNVGIAVGFGFMVDKWQGIQ